MNIELKSYFPKFLVDFYFLKWLVEDGSFVRKGEPIYSYSNSSILSDKLNDIGIELIKTITTHRAEKDGYIDVYYTNDDTRIANGTLMYTIRSNDEIRKSRKFVNTPSIKHDEFDDKKIIKWEKVSSLDKSSGIILLSNCEESTLTLSFNNINGCDFIIFEFYPATLKLRKNDSIYFMFNDSEVLKWNIERVKTTANINNEKVSYIECSVTEEELLSFKSKPLEKWKVQISSKNLDVIGGEIGGSEIYRGKANLQFAINHFTSDYINLVNYEIEDYKPLQSRKTSYQSENQSSDACHVYLMIDTSNGYYKIGISNKPGYREKTLQSEKPTIELICSKKFQIRQIAQGFEKSLHETFANKRLRGEWFELDEIDVEHLINALQ